MAATVTGTFRAFYKGNDLLCAVTAEGHRPRLLCVRKGTKAPRDPALYRYLHEAIREQERRAGAIPELTLAAEGHEQRWWAGS